MKIVISVAALAALIGVSPAGAQGQTNPVPALMKNLAADDVRVAASAARSLGIIFAPGDKRPADPVEPVIDALIPALESRKGAALRQEAAGALGKIKAAKALDGVKKAIDDEDVHVAIAAAGAVGSILPVDEARAYLKQRGKDKSQNVQAATYEALVPLAKPEDAEFLAAGLSSNNWRVQMNAVKGLDRAIRAGAKIGPETYDQVAGVLGSDTVNASEAALNFLVGIRSDECLRATIAAAGAHGDDGPQDTSWRTRTYALRTLRHMGWPANKPALPAVIRQLGDRAGNVTNEAHAILALLRKENRISQDELFPLLLTELEQAKPLRLRAAIMAEMGGHVETQYASRVAKAAGDTLDESMKDAAAWAPRARSIALLGAAGHTGSIETIAKCATDDTADVRIAVGESLEHLGKLCTPEQRGKVAPILIGVIDKPVDWRKAATAARALGFYPSKDAVEPLVKLLSHNILNVQDAAGSALVLLAKAEDKDLRAAVEKRVFAEMGEKEASWEFGSKVLGALLNKEAVPLLTNVLKRGQWRAQANAADAVAALGAVEKLTDPALNDALIQASQSEVLQVQKAANKALKVLAQGK